MKKSLPILILVGFLVAAHVVSAYTSVTNSSAWCTGATTLGTSNGLGTNTCLAYCAGLTAGCCTTNTKDIDGVVTYSCTAKSQVTYTGKADTYSTGCGLGENCIYNHWDADVMNYAPTPTATLTASSTAIVSGGSSTLTWSSTNATGCTASGAWSGSKATSGTQAVSPTTSSTYSLYCTGAGGNSTTVSTTVTVSATQADLTAGSVTPTTATVNSAVTLSSTLTNGGTASTGASFTNLFQRATDVSGTSATDIGTYSSPTLAASGTQTATLSYTFTSAATWYVRACADKSSAANTGTITESNESNNCCVWTAVVASAALVPTATLTASSTAIISGGSSTLTWSSTNATGCTGTNFTASGTSGSVTVSPITTTTYSVTCSGSASASATVTVSAALPDLTVSVVPVMSSGSSRTGDATTFTASSTNSGTANTSANFSNRFQIDLDANGTYDTTIDMASSTNALNVSTTKSVTSSAWTATVGTHKIRMCTDIPPITVGSVAESNENNNCGADLTFTITNYTSNSSVTYENAECSSGTLLGTSNVLTEITYFANPGVACTPYCQSVGAACCTEREKVFNDSSNPEPQSYIQYRCYAYTGSATTSKASTYSSSPPPGTGYFQETIFSWSATLLTYGTAVSASLVANPTTITTGQSSLLSWSSTGVNSCTPTATDDQWYTTAESQVVFLSERLSNSIDCGPEAAGAGYTYWNQTVIIHSGEVDPAETICTGFQTNTGVIAKPPSTAGNTSTSYRSGSTCANASGTCTGTNFNTLGATSGSTTTRPLVNTSYILACTNGSQTATSTATVTVSDVLAVSCAAAPVSQTLNTNVLWSSIVTGGIGVYEYSWTGTDSLAGTSQTVTKSYSTVGVKTATLTVTSGDETVVATCTPVTITEGTNTDLSANTPSLYSGLNEVGNNVTFQGTITNVGDNTVSTTFQNRFQVDIGGEGSYDMNLDASATSYTIGLGGTVTVVSPVWSTIPAGTHKIRFCSDLPPTGTGSVVESNENNNCSGTMTFAVGSLLLDMSIESSFDRVRTGSTVAITWTAQNADSCTVSGPGLASGGTSGTQNVTISGESTYTITCLRGTVYQSATVTVRVAPRFEEI